MLNIKKHAPYFGMGVIIGGFAVHAFYTWIWWASCG